MRKILFLLSILCVFNAYSEDGQIKILKSKGVKHIIRFNGNATYQQGDVITITDSDSKTAVFQILRVDKTGTKLLIKGNGNVPLQDICSFSCVSTASTASMDDEFADEPERMPASEEKAAQSTQPQPPANNMRSGFFGFGYSLVRDFTNSAPGIAETTESLDLSVGIFYEKYVFTKPMGSMALALGAFGGANIAVHRGEGYAESVDPILMLQPTIGVNINFIPMSFIRVFAGPNINYSIFTDREYFDLDFGTTVSEERAGGIGFGYQLGVRIVPGSFFAELKYQNISTNYDATLNILGAGSATVEVESSLSFLTLSIGTTF